MADGGTSVSFDPNTGDLIYDDGTQIAPQTDGEEGDHFRNMVDDLEDDALQGLSDNLTERVANDEDSRSEWLEGAKRGMDLLGIGPRSEPDDLEYENSDTSNHPLMLTALTRFMSKSLSTLMPLPHMVCRAEAASDLDQIEDEAQEDELRARHDGAIKRVEDYYADYLLKGDIPYTEDFDRVLMDCGIHGLGIKKIYNDLSRSRGQTRIDYVPLQDLIVSYDARNFSVGRVTHRIDLPTSDLIRRLRSGEYRSDDLVSSVDSLENDELTEVQDKIAGISQNMAAGSKHRIYEVRAHLFIEADKHPMNLSRPYVVTIHQATQSVLSIKRNWVPNDPDERAIECFVGYIYFPGMRATQGLGLGALLGNITESLRTGQRRGLDAAYLQNMPFGYKLRNATIRNSNTKIVPGEFIDVDAPTDSIQSALQVNMFNGPSPGLMQLMDRMEANGKELGGLQSIDFGSLMKAGVTAAPAMAAMEEASEFQTAIHRRMYDANAVEMTILHERTKEVRGEQPTPYGTGKMLNVGDLTMVNLLPVMKPGQVSRQKQLMEAQAIVEAADKAPDVVDRRRAYEEYMRALGRPDIEDFLIPDPADAPPPQPMDPASEYAAVMRGQPVAAGMAQNHQAHIDAHSSQLRIIQTSSMPVEEGTGAMQALAAHIADHMAKDMIQQVAAKTGIPIEQFGPEMPPEIEAQVAPQIAEAVNAVEEMRAPPEAVEESKVAIEQAKAQGKLSEAQMKAQQAKELEEMKHRHAMELQTKKDEAEMDRAIQDDDTAIQLAGEKARAGTISS